MPFNGSAIAKFSGLLTSTTAPVLLSVLHQHASIVLLTNDLVDLSITGGIGGGEADRVLGDGSEGARSLGRLDGAERPLELAAFHRISGRAIINWLQWGRDSPPQHCVRCMRRLWWVEEAGVFLRGGRRT
mgnify:CR=1 FL=1